jgi:hypothetical protein
MTFIQLTCHIIEGVLSMVSNFTGFLTSFTIDLKQKSLAFKYVKGKGHKSQLNF